MQLTENCSDIASRERPCAWAISHRAHENVVMARDLHEDHGRGVI